MRRILCVALVCLLLLSLCACGFSYTDYTEYVTLPTDWMSALDLPASFAVTQDELDAYLNALLLSYKTAVREGEEEYDKAAGNGDVLAFYYEGYLEDGTRITDGFSVGEGAPLGKPYLLELGSGSFPISEVEEALLGVVPSSSRLTVSGAVPQGAVVYLQCYYEEAGQTEYLFGTGRYDLATADQTMGDGFAAALVGREVGSFVTFTLTDDFNGDGTPTERTYSARICYASRGEMTLTGTYPTDYADETRAGKTVTFYVQPMYMVDYDTPTLTRETVTDVMGLFVGEDDPVAALREAARQQLLTSEERLADFEAALWAALGTEVQYDRLPEGQIKTLAKGLLDEMEEVYEYSKEYLYDACVQQFGEAAMESLDSFVRASYGVTEGTAKSLTQAEAERQVKENLVLYALGEHYSILPEQEDLTAGAEALLAEDISLSGMTEKALLRRFGGISYYEAQYCYGYVLCQLILLCDAEG